MVLDAFCACGTTVHTATHLAISLIEKRLNDAFPGIKYEVLALRKDLDGARALSAHDKCQFQWWAVSLVDAVTEAVKCAYYATIYGKYPKIQILTIRELFEGNQPNIPLVDSSAFKKVPKESEGDQDKLPL